MNIMLKLFGFQIFHFHIDGGGYPSVHAVEYVPVEEDWEGVKDAVDELVGCGARIDEELFLMDPAHRPLWNI